MATNQITSFTFQWIIFCNVFFFSSLCIIASVFDCLFYSSLFSFYFEISDDFFLPLLLYWWNKIHCIFYEWTVIVNMVEWTHTYFAYEMLVSSSRDTSVVNWIVHKWTNDRSFSTRLIFSNCFIYGTRIGICTHENFFSILFMDLLFTKKKIWCGMKTMGYFCQKFHYKL